MTRYHVCNDYSLEEMKPEDITDESKYNTRLRKGGTLCTHRKHQEAHYFIIDEPSLTGQYLT